MQVSSATGVQAADMVRQLRERSFSRADRDGNGGLSLEEFAALSPGKPGDRVSEPSQVKEAASFSAAVFARVDANGDGLITEAEMEAIQPGAPVTSPTLSSATMTALLSGQEALASRDGNHTVAPKEGNTTAGPSGPTARLVEALDRYLSFSASQPPAGDPAGG
ncbi:hypothetical protein D9599_15145 [Roseomonas sp. KE2513]|uniref:hypothetical protein n=1 Tax=Roseomonas sp. KE2513 TaxID=2479202 RepID=UPI0018DFCB22|nr:hypothetical protein [Roseomonas sp. KE2513]MBI0536907.1 hypothetical protein [Roseomonas sp. KE2513]